MFTGVPIYPEMDMVIAPVEEKKNPIVEEHKQYAYELVTQKWNEEEWKPFDQIIKNESGWKVNTEHNPVLSSAYGLGGFLDSTWETVGCSKTPNKDIQIECTAKYIEKRYETPTIALDFHLKNGWY